MRVGLDLIPVRPESGGVHSLIRDLVPVLLRRHPQHEYHIFQARDVAPFAGAGSGARQHFLDPRDLAKELSRAAARSAPDVLFRAFPLGAPLDFPLDRQVVLIPDLLHEHLGEECAPALLAERVHAFRSVQGGAGAIGTLSNFCIDALRASPHTRCEDLFLMQPGGDAPKPGGILPHEAGAEPYLFFPANLWPHKNHVRLLEAFGLLLQRIRQPLRLVLTGNPDGWPALQLRFPDLPVTHLGRVSDAQLWALYRHARGLCFFSQYEGFGIPLLEAFAAGVPVACSNVCSLPEVGGGAVLACDPADTNAMALAMEKLCMDTTLRERLVAKGRARLAKFTWEKCSDNLASALTRVFFRAERAMQDSFAMVDRPPEISVVVPAFDHRGRLERCLESLLARQTCAPERYEIIVATNGLDPGLDRMAAEKLGRRGRLVAHAFGNDVALYHHGSLAARAKLLFFTEAHCEAEPGCIAALLDYFSQGGPGGLAQARSASACEFAEFEGDFYSEMAAQWSQSEDWRKVGMRGFAIRLEIFERAGGWSWRHGLFAERLMAGALAGQGVKLDYISGAQVLHYNAETWPELESSIRNFTRGECAGRDTLAPEWMQQRFGAPPAWLAESNHGRQAARALLRASARAALGRGMRWPERLRAARLCLGRALRDGPSAWLGLRWTLWCLRTKWRLERLRCALHPRRAERFAAYRRGWDLLSNYHRVLYHLAQPMPTAGLVAQQSFSFQEPEGWQAFGFHGTELYEGRCMRWSGPVAVLRFAALPQDACVAIETGGFSRPRNLALYFNHCRVPAGDVSLEGGWLRFPARHGDFRGKRPQEISWVCQPLDTSTWPTPDPRALGMPVFGLRLEPA